MSAHFDDNLLTDHAKLIMCKLLENNQKNEKEIINNKNLIVTDKNRISIEPDKEGQTMQSNESALPLNATFKNLNLKNKLNRENASDENSAKIKCDITLDSSSSRHKNDSFDIKYNNLPKNNSSENLKDKDDKKNMISQQVTLSLVNHIPSEKTNNPTNCTVEDKSLVKTQNIHEIALMNSKKPQNTRIYSSIPEERCKPIYDPLRENKLDDDAVRKFYKSYAELLSFERDMAIMKKKKTENKSMIKTFLDASDDDLRLQIFVELHKNLKIVNTAETCLKNSTCFGHQEVIDIDTLTYNQPVSDSIECKYGEKNLIFTIGIEEYTPEELVWLLTRR